MNKKSILVLATIIALSQVLVFCGKTDTDLEWEESLIGYWIPVDDLNNPLFDMPSYSFFDDTRGVSYYTSFEEADTFSWEIKRGQLKLYYDRAPSYHIGYDKYNSRSVFKINSVHDTAINVTMFLSSGYQKEFNMLKSSLLEEEEDF